MESQVRVVKDESYCYSEQTGRGSIAVTTPLGEKIRELRKKKGYTLDKLAELADSSKSYIWELENKNPPRPSAEKVAKIAAVLGVTADYLIDATNTIDAVDAKDDAFFRQYRRMDPGTKDRIRQMVDLMKPRDTDEEK